MTRQARDAGPVMVQCRAGIADAGPALHHHLTAVEEIADDRLARTTGHQ